jgi:adenylate cyclase
MPFLRFPQLAWRPLHQWLWRERGILIATPTIAALVVLVRLTGGFQPLEWAALDFYFRSRPVEARDDRIVIIGITEQDIREYQTPLPDRVLAQLIEKINAQKPSVIGLDLYRNIPVEPGYADLVRTFTTTPNLIGIRKVVGDGLTDAVDPPPELAKLGKIAANDVVVDADGKLRRGLLYLQDDQVFSLALTLAWSYLQDHQIKPEITGNQIKLGKATFNPLEPNDGGYVRANTEGYQILLNFRGPQSSFTTFSVQDVLANRIPPHRLRDRIVLIGPITESLKDFYYTPYNYNFTQILRPTPGVEIHAHLTSQIISSALEGRPGILTLPKGLEWLCIISCAWLGAWIVWRQRSTRQGSQSITPMHPILWRNLISPQSLQILISLLAAAVGVIGLSYGAFLASWWVPVVPSLCALGGSAIGVTGYFAQTVAEMRRTLGRYLTDEVVASLLETPGGLNLEGEKRKVTTLISDLRGFTAISERLPPEQVVKLLNLHLEVMTKVIRSYGGTINDVTGDGMVVFFGAPTQKPDDAQRAVACAIAMQLAMATVNQKNQTLNLPHLEMGIGLNTGEVVVGNIGSQEHAKYTAIGSHVNLAARIESFTVGGQILISHATLTETQTVLTIQGQTQATLKGFESTVPLYDVSGIGGTFNLFLPQTPETLIPLTDPIPLHYRLLEGKQLGDDVFPGQIVQLSHKIAEIHTRHPMPPLSNLKLNLYPQTESGAEIYAKVITQPVQDDQGFYVRFTMVSPTVAAIFERLNSNALPETPIADL